MIKDFILGLFWELWKNREHPGDKVKRINAAWWNRRKK